MSSPPTEQAAEHAEQPRQATSPRRGKRKSKPKKRRSKSEDKTEHTSTNTPKLEPVQEHSHEELAKLREHLAFTRESYNESLKELQEVQAIAVADRIELEQLRKVLQEQLEREKLKAEQEKVLVVGYDSDAEEETKSNDSTPQLPLEKWYQDLQGLIKDKADAELRVKGMVNQMRDLKYLMKQLQDENSSLKVVVANLQTTDAGGKAEDNEAKETETGKAEELQQQVNKWEALYFETADTGAKTIERLEKDVAKLQEENGNLEFERNEAIQALATDRAIRAATRTSRGTQYLPYEDNESHEEKKEDGLNEDDATPVASPGQGSGDPNGIDSSLSSTMYEVRRSVQAGGGAQEDEMVWMEKFEEMEKIVRNKDHAIAELHQQLYIMTQQRIQHQAKMKEQEEELQRQQTMKKQAVSIAGGDDKSINLIRKEHEMTFSAPTLAMFDIEQTVQTAVRDIFCCGNPAQVAPDNGTVNTIKRDQMN